MIKFFINDTDLTNRTPTKNGRFRIIVDKDAVKNNVYRMVDSDDGRGWSFRLKLKPEKCEFVMLNEAMK